MDTLTFFSPAKINLFLRVLKKRPDGYHEIASLFQAIDLGDTLTFSFSEVDHFSCSDLSLNNPTNLVIKALNLFRQKTGFSSSVKIHLEKRIPLQAGLGGGSSNAATTLWALNALHKYPVAEPELQKWASGLGSDVPFFFSRGTAYCKGRGEIVENVTPIRFDLPLVLYKPQEALATPDVFRALVLNECSSEHPDKLLQSFYTDKPFFINDLEKPATKLLPILQTIKEGLRQNHIQSPTLTGSGTAFFGFHPQPLRKISLINRASSTWFGPS